MIFDNDKVKAFFTTKNDGNIAFHVVDEESFENVKKAREELSITYNIDLSRLKHMDQVHGNDVALVDTKKDLYRCDALITDKKNTPLMIMSADCIGILFFDSEKNAIGVAHAGRNGTFLEIAKNTILAMNKNFGSKVENIKVHLGPSIQKCCYEVSQELADIAMKNFGEEFVEKRNLDLQGINKKQLLDLGVNEENIFIDKLCTKCQGEDYFSYRNDKNCGRFAGIITIL